MRSAAPGWQACDAFFADQSVEVAHRRAGQAMAELEAEHKARQQGATRWREAKEFAHLLDLVDVVDIPTAAE